MYRYSDLQKLKKDDIAQICRVNSILDENVNSKSCTKKRLLDCLVEFGVCSKESKSSAVPALTAPGDIELPIELTSTILQYDDITDVNLGLVPYVSFECLYKYLCHDGTSLKTMDRAVKHAESGDVFSLSMCEVSSCCIMEYEGHFNLFSEC